MDKPEDELNLDLIQELGGTKDDLRLLADLRGKEEAEDVEFAADDFETEPIKKEEIHNFMQELGIFDYGPNADKEKKKPKKLVSVPVEEDSGAEESKSGPSTSDSFKTENKKKKKKKVKADDSASDLNQPKNEKKSKDVKATVVETESQKKKKITNKFKIQDSKVSSSTGDGKEELTKHLKGHPQRAYLLVKPGDAWYGEQNESSAEETTNTLVHQCEQFAKKLLEDEVARYKTQREKTKRGESNWIKTVLTSGTLTDKMAALMLLVQESPTHNMAALDSLIGMANKKGKREAMLASDTLKSLFVSETSPLPQDRRLISFDSRPFSSLWQMCSGNKDSIDKRLMMWHAEDLLREKYASFMKALDVMSYDTLFACKEKALAIIHSLLTSRPEQEDKLLPMLVNKLGDPNHKIASKASYLLIKLVEQHPNMKSVIMDAVEQLLYRTNISHRAQYYSMCFLNQIRLHKSDHSMASTLIKIYFSFFKTYMKKGEVDSKMMAALLSGVNRAYPYAKLKPDSLSEEVAPLYKIVHIVNFNTSIQALMLLFHVVDPSNSDSDRYFMALYRKLLDPALRTSAKQPQFLNLLYKSMKSDVMDQRVKAIVKRLLQVGSTMGPDFLCGALIIISEVVKERPGLLTLKQLGYVTGNSNDLGNKMSKFMDDDDEDEVEKFVDLPVPPEFQTEQDKDKATEKHTGESDQEGNNRDGGEKTEKEAGSQHKRLPIGKSEEKGYDCYHRNPLHCQADNECLWELQALTHHYHPSVCVFATTLLKGEPIEYPSDPLQDFTLIRFLDRFVYKNPKKKETDEKSETVGVVSKRGKVVTNVVPVNSEEFLKGGEEAVPEHERFLYRYFSQRAETKKKEEGEESETESVSDTEFDDFLDNYEKQYDQDGLGKMDFGEDFAKNMGMKKTGGLLGDSDQESDEEEDLGGLSDEEIDFDDDDELAAEFRKEMDGLKDEEENDEENEEDEDFSGDELKQMMVSGSKKQSRKREDEEDFDLPPTKKAKRSRSGNLASMFAAADDFADLLEENTDGASVTMGTADDVWNKDKASAKQIAWEANRERNTDGRHSKQKQQRKFKSKGGKPFNKGHNHRSRPHKGHKGKGKKRK